MVMPVGVSVPSRAVPGAGEINQSVPTPPSSTELGCQVRPPSSETKTELVSGFRSGTVLEGGGGVQTSQISRPSGVVAALTAVAPAEQDPVILCHEEPAFMVMASKLGSKPSRSNPVTPKEVAPAMANGGVSVVSQLLPPSALIRTEFSVRLTKLPCTAQAMPS